MSPTSESSILSYRCVTGLIVMVSLLGNLGSGDLGTSRLVAEDWPGFHGGPKAGVVSDGRLPDRLDRESSRWIVDLGSRDVGSMAVQDGLVYLLATDSDAPEIRLVSIELDTGKTRWTKTYSNAPNHLHRRNTLASSTPATDDEFVYIAHSDRTHTWLRCLDHDGNEIWQRDFGAAQSQHGFGTSPTVHGDVVLLNFSQQAERVREGDPGTSHIIAVDRKSGKTLWQTPLTSTRVCYGVPAVHDGQVIGANTGDGVFALSLEDGKLLWRIPVFKMRCVSSPIVAGDLVIGTSGSGGGGNHLVAVRMPTSDMPEPTEAYRVERFAPYVPTPVVQAGSMYCVDDKGIASCIDLKSGELVWRQRLGGNFGASPLMVGDRVLMISLDGEATILRASREFESLGKFDLDGPVGATPAYVDGKLLLRVGNELRCL